ncbi:hypothetical protein KL86PLE_90610 [uncultured Pleomorphomonas sp.]|uniref:Sel1 domain protein repeat-containing protein n=1 Tax=uncultured Pleomorphomonas sp. TaxID=442121 RepID=A0A212LQN1_9HYPH|nr:hypothetical protein KL86PLE_90610 [uncultured Pleomorphomonas sp.]
MVRNYVISCEARRLAAQAWDRLRGRETEFGKDEAIALFAALRPVDENFYHYNICKLLFRRGDGDFASFGDCKFGPTQFIVAQGYRWGKGVAPNLDLARRHYRLGFRLGNIPCFLALFSMLAVRDKLKSLVAMLVQSVGFVYLKSRSEDDTRIMY